ncbi:MAG: Rne/Rng family ribonuclease [Alphaproteobacteria bacterium GM202ARS2]|nr:Rne/Rng family ribonuclease [Alphaproteobacteria bacterium GM202ARS2]
MTRILVDCHNNTETRVAVVLNNKLEYFYHEDQKQPSSRGNIYLAKVMRIEPSLQAAFVDYGQERQGFLPFTEIHPDYYQIPVEDQSATAPAGNDKADVVYIDDSTDIVKQLDGEQGTRSFDETSSGGRGSGGGSDRSSSSRPYLIQDVIRNHQLMMVQVQKEIRNTKGASLTTRISLCGVHTVLLPNTENGGGISSKITDEKKREHLSAVIKKLGLPDGMSLILRTAAADASANDIKKDYTTLMQLWDTIRETAVTSTAPLLVHEEARLMQKVARDYYTSNIQEIVVGGDTTYEDVRTAMQTYRPSQVKNVKRYQGNDLTMFEEFGVEEDLRALYGRIAPLSSGAYLVIDLTEAMVVIDINSGSNTKNRNIQETALAINLEAAEEIARQLRLRELSGLIVIDFIDMANSKDSIKVENCLREALQKDHARSSLGHISHFGILEMTRQRLTKSFTESHSQLCPACGGSGRVQAPQTVLYALSNTLQKKIRTSSGTTDYQVSLPASLAEFCLNDSMDVLKAIIDTHNVTIKLSIDPTLGNGDFRIHDGNRVTVHTSSPNLEVVKNTSYRSSAPRARSQPTKSQKRGFFGSTFGRRSK